MSDERRDQLDTGNKGRGKDDNRIRHKENCKTVKNVLGEDCKECTFHADVSRCKAFCSEEVCNHGVEV